MKISACAILITLSSSTVSSFVTQNARPSQHDTSLSMKQPTSRSDFLKTAALATTSLAFLSIPTAPANAAKYGGFGKGSPEVINPKDAIIDTDILATEAVQKALTEVKTTLETVKSLKGVIAADPQAILAPQVRKGFEISGLRASLQTLNTAFDEDTQRGTDRIIRIILQDIAELEIAATQKVGVPRSERRLGIVCGKLDKLQKAFEDLLAFSVL